MSDDNPKYYPPSHDVLVHFAQTVGDELGGEFTEHDIVHGLADFMSVVARVLAADKNRKQHSEFDNGVE